MKQKLTYAMRRLWQTTKLLFALGFTLAITLFIYLSSIEVVMSKDFKYLSSIETIEGVVLESFQNYDTHPTAPNLAGNAVGEFGELESILFPTIQRKVSLVKGVRKDDGLLARANAASYLTERKNRSVENVLVYARQSWRGVNTPEAIQVGDNIFVDTNRDWRYMFRIEDIEKRNNAQGVYVVTDSSNPQLIVLIQDTATNETYLYRAVFVTVNNINR